MGVRVLHLTQNSGPAAARNYGASQAEGDILFFVDADVVIAPDAVRRLTTQFAERADLAAIFGSYDARPRASGVISRYRNLLHHFVHQQGKTEAATFWAGCGAIRRVVFEAVGGFDARRFPRPSIEDIELGYRLYHATHRILLDKALQGTHLKRWTLWSVVRTDVCCRAIPWARLMFERPPPPADLNLKPGQRLSVALVGLASSCLLLAVFWGALLGLGAVALLGVLLLNRDLFGFFRRQHGLGFAMLCFALHLLHYLYSGLSYAWVWLTFHLKGTLPHAHRPPDGEEYVGAESARPQPHSGPVRAGKA
jgi:hypothetical protein